MQHLLAFDQRARAIAAHFGAHLITADASVVLQRVRYYCSYSLPNDAEPWCSPDCKSIERALSKLRDELAARTDNRPTGLFSPN